MTKTVLSSGTAEELEILLSAARDLAASLKKAGWADSKGDTGASEKCLLVLSCLISADLRINDIYETLPPHTREISTDDILDSISEQGHHIRKFRGYAKDIDARLLPALFIRDNPAEKPCLLLADGKEGTICYDGETDQIFSPAESAYLLQSHGTCHVFTPFEAQRQSTSRFTRKASGYSWFRALLGRFSGTFKQIILAGLALNIVTLSAPLFMMTVYDRVISPSDTTSLIGLASGMAIALIAEHFLRNNRSSALSWLSARLGNIVGNKIVFQLLHITPEIAERIPVAAQIARIRTFESVRDLFSGAVFLSFLEIPYVILAVLLIAALGGWLVLVPVAAVTAFTLLFLYMRQKVKVVIRLAAKASSARQHFTIETFSKTEDIRACGLEKKWQERYEDIVGKEVMLNFRLGWLGTVAETLAQALTLVAGVATIGFGTLMVWSGNLSTGGLIACMMLVWRVITPFYSLCAMIPRLEQLRNSILQVNDLMDIETEIDTAAGKARLPVLRGRITLQNAGLKFGDNAEPALQHNNLDVTPGKIIIVTGASGSGKSGLLKIIKGLYRPQTGAMRIDGFDARQLNAPHLRRQIALITQNPGIFTSSIADNLRLAKPLATTEEIERALFLADAQDDIKKMPDKLNAEVSPDTISASLRHKISLARAYLHGGNILLIDELPSSLVDGRAGLNLRRYLEKTRGKKTVVIVTNNPDLMDLGDEFYQLEKGMPLIRAQKPLQEFSLQEKAS